MGLTTANSEGRQVARRRTEMGQLDLVNDCVCKCTTVTASQQPVVVQGHCQEGPCDTGMQCALRLSAVFALLVTVHSQMLGQYSRVSFVLIEAFLWFSKPCLL